MKPPVVSVLASVTISITLTCIIVELTLHLDELNEAMGGWGGAVVVLLLPTLLGVIAYGLTYKHYQYWMVTALSMVTISTLGWWFAEQPDEPMYPTWVAVVLYLLATSLLALAVGALASFVKSAVHR